VEPFAVKLRADDAGAFLISSYAPPLPAALVEFAIIRQALAADAPRAFRRRCWSAIGARVRQRARLVGMSDTTVRYEARHRRVVVTVEGA
jgi:hypothetical protein